LGCIDVQTTKIRVATIPSFAGTTSLLEDTICFGESTILVGGVTFQDTAGVDPTQGAFINGGIFAGLTYLPDGSGVNYETEIEITQFDSGQVVQDPSDIIDVCVTMEHSYLGDLEMMLTCPNGTEVVIFNSYTGTGINGNFAGGFGGGGTFLGDPVDNTSGQPGIGWEYCFSELATWGTMGDEHPGNTMGTTIEGGPSMSPGTYQPEQTYADLLGCPINGTWTLTIRDNIGADDGYIFEWGILFNPDIDPNAEFYTPSLASGWWTIEPSVINVFGDTAIEVLPPNPGDWGYTFNVEDDFGCFHDTTLNVHMVPPLSNLLNDTAVCSDQFALTAADYEILGEWSYTPPLGGSATFTPNEFDHEPTVTVSQYGDYEFIYESDYCGQSDTIIIDFNPVPSPVQLQDQTVCPGATLTFDAENAGIAAVYNWQPTGETTQQITIENITQTTGVQVIVNNECGSANGAATITVESLDVSGPSDVCLEDVAELNADFTTSGGVWTYTTPAGGDATLSPSETDAAPDASATAEGAYRFIFTDDDCGMTDSVDVFFTPAPTVDVTIDTNRICVEDNAVLTFSTNTQLYDSFSWEPFGTNEDTLVILGIDSTAFNPIDTSFHVIATVSNYCGDDSQEIVYKVIDCTLDLPNVFNPESSVLENSYFNVTALDLHPGNNMKIFDRWGRKVLDQDNYHLSPWNGGKNSDGVYYYVLTRPGYEAETGYVHLVRGSGQ
jgi:subtilisin-like proprotein convertase family protein